MASSMQRALVPFGDAELVLSDSLLSEAYVRLEMWKECVEAGSRLAQAFKACPFPYPNLGVQHLMNGRISLLLNDPVEAQRSFLEAETALRLTHGPNHLIFNTHVRQLLERSGMEVEALKQMKQRKK